MNFLGLGPGEMMLILVLALIIVGPQKLPEMATQIGKTIRDFRRSTTEISAEFQRSFSLEEQAQPEPVGPAAVFASNGVAAEATTEGATEPVATQSDPPLADTSNWAWETSPGATVQSGAVTSSGSFWEWDSQPEAVAQVGDAGEKGASTGQVQRAPEAGSSWEWDTGEAAPVASSTGVVEEVPAASVAEPPADGVALGDQPAAAEPKTGERRARRPVADDGAAAATSQREEPVT